MGEWEGPSSTKPINFIIEKYELRTVNNLHIIPTTSAGTFFPEYACTRNMCNNGEGQVAVRANYSHNGETSSVPCGRNSNFQ